MITIEDFERFEKVRKSGVVNMLDITKISIVSGLDKEKILEILSEYNDFKESYEEKK